MPKTLFQHAFKGHPGRYLRRAIDLALAEDGPDLTSLALFGPDDILRAEIRAKQDTIVCGLPIVPLVFRRLLGRLHKRVSITNLADEGSTVTSGTIICRLRGPAADILKAERIALNFMTHLCGIANLTARYVAALKDSPTRLLDTRKTMPGLRHAEKYAVLIGGGQNHRHDLAEMLMLKDNHIDQAGSIPKAVDTLRTAYSPCPPIEVECRTLDDVRQAVACNVSRIMLDNMTPDQMRQALTLIPPSIESEISGGVSLETIATLATLKPTYISVGRLTHSAPSADLSMRVQRDSTQSQ